MTPDEVRMLDNRYALLFIRGERPVMDLKYDILKHPDVSMTTDGKMDQFYDIHMKNGNVLSYAEDYDIPAGKGIIGDFKRGTRKFLEYGDAKELCEMVKQANRTVVEPQDVLSDNVYHYSRDERRLDKVNAEPSRADRVAEAR